MGEVVKNSWVRIYTPELQFLGEIDNYTQLQWTRRFYEPGEFEMRLPITEDNLKYLKPGNIIRLKGANEAGVIEDIENHEGGGSRELIRRGRFLSSYLDRRLIKKTVNFNGFVEVAMRLLVSGAAPIPLVTLGEIHGFPEQVEFQATMKNLQVYLTKLSRSSLIGYRIRPDFRTRVLYFETYKGVDRTRSQGVNNRVIFSDKYKNLNKASYCYNDQQYKTEFTVGGEGEGSARTYITIGGGTGLDLREAFVDARDLRSEDLTAAQYRATLKQRGLEAQAEAVIAESLECITQADINFAYKTKYDLGDTVSIVKKSWGVDMDKIMTEILEVHSGGNVDIVPTLGEPIPEKIDWSE